MGCLLQHQVYRRLSFQNPKTNAPQRPRGLAGCCFSCRYTIDPESGRLPPAYIAKQNSRNRYSLPDKLPEQTVSIAPAAVFRIVENIVSNALRYCQSQIDLNFSYSQPFFIITVTDDGKGFSAQDRAEAVNHFYKRKKEKEHFGIGLTICKILTEKHGGTISLDNAPEGGAKVTVKLKIEEVSPL